MEIDYKTITWEPPCPTLFKSYALVTHVDNVGWPILYFRKTRHITDEQYEELMRRMRMSVVTK